VVRFGSFLFSRAFDRYRRSWWQFWKPRT
jgi:hypothetical protein